VLIVDSQVHIWAADTPERPWPPIVHPTQSRPHKAEPFTKDDLLREMEGAGVDRAVLVPAVWEGERNDVAVAAVQAHPDRFAIMGRFNPEEPASRTLMPTWRQQPGMLGVRHCVPPAPEAATANRRPHRLVVASGGTGRRTDYVICVARGYVSDRPSCRASPAT